MKNKSKTALILLSGGLDSAVSCAKSKYEIKLGLLFDYGQTAFKMEKAAAKKISKYYNFPLKIITLDFLKEITKNGLMNSDEIYQIEDFNNKNELLKSMESVWVPNRNSLFINIAASYCEAFNIDKIIIGANKEEGETFKDNSTNFIKACNKLLKESSNNKIEVVAPLIDLNKTEIIKEGIKLKAPLEYIYSCYKGQEKHCGECESCLHLKNALTDNNQKDLIKKLF